MGKIKKIFTCWRVIILVLFLIFALLSIQPQIFGTEGVTIRSVVPNSSASNAGIENPGSTLTPLAKEKILSVNGHKTNSVEEYFDVVNSLSFNKTVRVETNKRVYSLLVPSSGYGNVDLGLKISEAPTNNIRKGLDLEGGTRVLLKPAEPVSAEDLDLTITNLKERLNVYGLSDIVIRSASDLAGEKFILIEIAGVTEDEVNNFLAKQGKFEAKIANNTVFFGGKKDITYVCRSAECSGIDPRRTCSQVEGGYNCAFYFGITLSPDAADRQSEMTKDLTIISEEGGRFLSEDIVLYLDDKEVDRLKIGAELKGRSTTSIQISGSGAGRTKQEGVTNALQQMKRLQTVIITGSLPIKLEVVKFDTISPSLGKEFLFNIVLVGALAVFSIVTVVLIKYRKIKIVLPMALVLVSELFLILGFAAVVGWNLDLAAIAGIIIVAGTGVDHLIIITDEALKGEIITDWKKKIKNAMFIIMGAYLVGVSSMIPLWFAGAGLLKGFAFTTIVGLSFGVLVARPAYAAIIEILLNE